MGWRLTADSFWRQTGRKVEISRLINQALPTPVSERSRAVLLRGVWLVITTGVIILLAAATPWRLRMLRADVYGFGEGLQAMGLSLNFFAAYFVFWELLVAGGALLVAALIAWKRADDWFAILVAVTLSIFGLLPPLIEGLVYASPQWALPVGLLRLLAMSCMMAVVCLFPNGRFSPSWTRWLLLLWLLFALLVALFDPLVVAETAVLPNTRTIEDARWVLVGVTWFLAAIAGQVIRYHDYATPAEKQQTKWVLFGFSLTIIFSLVSALLLISFPGLTSSPGNEAGMVVIMGGIYLLTALVLPVAIALSILRYRLWDVDILLNRTLVYGGLSVSIIIVHILFVGGVGTLATGEQSSLAAFAVATMIVLVTLRPLHRRLQNQADRIIKPQAAAPPPNQISSPVQPDGLPAQDKELRQSDSVRLSLNRTAVLLIPWVVVAVAILAIYAADLRLSYNMIAAPCEGKDCHYQALTMAEAQALADMGLSVRAYAIYILGTTVLTVALFVTLATWMLLRLYPQRVGLLFSILLIIIPATAITSIDVVAAAYPSWAAPIQLLFAICQVLTLSFFLVFPNGRLKPRWIILIPVLIGILGIYLPANEALGRSVSLLIISALLISLFAIVVYRYRRQFNHTERQQTKWVLLGMLIFLLGVPIWSFTFEWSSPAPGQAKLITILGGWTLSQMTMLALPITIVIAIFYSRLWNVDTLINRSLVYGGLSLGIVAIYVLTVGALGTLFHAQGNFLFALLATGLIAVLFQPVRGRLQQGVNRLMFGERDDPYKVLSQMGQQLQTASTPDATLQSLVETIATTLKLPYAAITLRAIELTGEEGRLNGAVTGKAVAETVEFPLRYQNETVGYLVVSPRSPGESFTDREQQLLADIAGQAGAMAYSVRLTAALQQSREKMVLAREEERRRIRRDLHDELGPTLASQTFALDTALEALETDPQMAAQLLQALKSQNQETVSGIRRLVYELRPPALDELGLVGALEAQAGRLSNRNSLQISIISEPDPPPPFSAAVEVAAYRIALEAITNVVRHAGAAKCTVRLRIEKPIPNPQSQTRAEPGRSAPNQLIVEILDDGAGLPSDYSPGVGLHSMRERAEELGGFFERGPGEKGGTRVTAVLPL